MYLNKGHAVKRKAGGKKQKQKARIAITDLTRDPVFPIHLTRQAKQLHFTSSSLTTYCQTNYESRTQLIKLTVFLYFALALSDSSLYGPKRLSNA